MSLRNKQRKESFRRGASLARPSLLLKYLTTSEVPDNLQGNFGWPMNPTGYSLTKSGIWQKAAESADKQKFS
jgi:hypothetical protein